MTSTTPEVAAPIDLQQLLARSWRLFTEQPVAYLLAGLAVVFIGSLTVGILAGPLCVGFIRMVDKHARREAIHPGDVWSGMQSFGAGFVTTLLVVAGVVIASMLFVLPGVILGFFLSY